MHYFAHGAGCSPIFPANADRRPSTQNQGSFLGQRSEQRAGFAVAKVRRRLPPDRGASLKSRVEQALEELVGRETFFFCAPDERTRDGGAQRTAKLPDFVILSKGRSFGLALKSPNGTLSSAERAAHLALRDAGMRIEIARSLGEALEHLREMGVALKPREDVHSIFPRRSSWSA
jgi:hypothetical protein